MVARFGLQAQQKLANSKVLVIGAGGLGCPALIYLAACGVGHLGIVDADLVQNSNLHRQIIYGASHLNQAKVIVAQKYLSQQYPDIKIDTYQTYIDWSNATQILSPYDVVIDCTDNFFSRYLINEACVNLGKALVFGAVYQNEGQVAIFNVDYEGYKTQYRDIFPYPPAENESPDCNQTGVIGIQTGIIGNLMAAECIKLITSYGNALIHRLMIYNWANNDIYKINIKPSSHNLEPIDYQALSLLNAKCNIGLLNESQIVDWETALEWSRQTKVLLLDIRATDELPKLDLAACKSIPMPALASRLNELNAFQKVLIFCQSGIRSTKVLEGLQQKQVPFKPFSIRGGIKALETSHHKHLCKY